jgi:hypothetical protein
VEEIHLAAAFNTTITDLTGTVYVRGRMGFTAFLKSEQILGKRLGIHSLKPAPAESRSDFGTNTLKLFGGEGTARERWRRSLHSREILKRSG